MDKTKYMSIGNHKCEYLNEVWSDKKRAIVSSAMEQKCNRESKKLYVVKSLRVV